eukprot:jgi/Mesvir1/6574/Mv26307-RA.1
MPVSLPLEVPSSPFFSGTASAFLSSTSIFALMIVLMPVLTPSQKTKQRDSGKNVQLSSFQAHSSSVTWFYSKTPPIGAATALQHCQLSRKKDKPPLYLRDLPMAGDSASIQHIYQLSAQSGVGPVVA